MLNACPERPQLSHILRTGEPLAVKYPERDDVEVVELSNDKYAEIVENRSKQLERNTYEY